MKHRVQAVREQLGLSKAKLSKISGVSLSFINYIEAGQKSPTLRTLEKLAKAMGVSVAVLFEENSSEKKPE